MHQWSAYHSRRYFVEPDEFRPERWMNDHKGYETDKREVVQPFHVGPRNCLGRKYAACFHFPDELALTIIHSLAYLEMRFLIARLVWQFDMALDPSSATWNEQKAYLLWQKPEMLVKLARRTQ